MILQRLREWRHERYIQRLSRQCRAAIRQQDRAKASLYWVLMVAAIKRRSPASVARMERRTGIG